MTDLRFRYDENNISSMLAQIKHEYKKVCEYGLTWVKPFVNSKVKRSFPFRQERIITTKRGNKWHLYLMATCEENLHDEHAIFFFSFMEYTCKHGRGIIIMQYMNGHDTVYDITPHAIARYRQRYLTERNINVSWEEQIKIMVESFFCHDINIDGNLSILMSEQGAFYGDYIGNAWMHFKTFVAYENAYRNQREVLDYVRKDIADRKQEMLDGLLPDQVEKKITIAGTYKDITKKMIKKSGMYHEYANKRNDKYINSVK